MNKFIASTAAAVFALSLAATSFAAAPIKDLGNDVTEVDFQGNNASQWGLGPMSYDIDGGIKVMNVKPAAGISVALNNATIGATTDKVGLSVSVDSNVQPGTYPVTVTLENAQFGDEGTITFNVVVK